MKTIFACLILLCGMASSFAATVTFDAGDGRHFIEVYQQESVWVVEEFLVEPGKLQERILRRTFPHEFQAVDLSKEIQRGRTTQVKSFTLVAREANAVPLWKVTQSWNLDWEEKYGDWVAKNFDKDFFVRHKLATDCADVAYALRWIFARDNGLPMGATLASTQTLFTQDNGKAEWAKLPMHPEWHKDQRFLAGLNWLLDNVYTGTLWIDGYPLEISKRALRVGTINLLGGHTEVFSRIREDGQGMPISLLSSTVPRAIRELDERGMTDGDPVKATEGGLFQFRWLEKISGAWKLRKKEEMPLYSLEQYESELCDDTKQFSLCIYKKLGLEFNPKAAINSMVQSLTSLTEGRIAVVQEGLKYCANTDCSPGTAAYEDWSTPSRDKRLVGAYEDANDVVVELVAIGGTELSKLWEQSLKGKLLTEVQGGFSLKTFLDRLQMKLTSSDPRDTWEMRWGSTTDAVANHVAKSFERQNILREELLQSASICRLKRTNCRLGTAAFNQLHTFYIDSTLRTTLANYGKFCLTEKCPLDSLPSKWEHVWFSSSLPWDGIELRRGINSKRQSANIFYGANTFIEVRNLLFINSEVLVHGKTGVSVSIPAGTRLRYLKNQKRLIAYGTPQSYEWNGDNFRPLSKELSLSLHLGMYEIGENHVATVNYRVRPYVLSIFDWQTGSLKKTMPVSVIREDLENRKAIIVEGGSEQGNWILSEEGSEIIQTPTDSGIRILGRTAHGWLGTKGDLEARTNAIFEFSSSGKRKVLELPTLHNIEPIGTDWIALNNENVWLIDGLTWKVRQHFKGSHLGKQSALNSTLFSILNEDDGAIHYLSRGSAYQELDILQGHYVMAYHDDWISYFDDRRRENIIIDHQGHEILKSKDENVERCSDWVSTGECLANLSEMGLWRYVHTEDRRTSWTIKNFGTYGKLQLHLEPWSQSIERQSEDEVDFNMGESNEIIVERGSAFVPHEGVILFFPAKN